MPGRHNVQNALAAIGVALELGIDDAAIRDGFSRFAGVKRRFTRVGEVDGAVVIDDYGHHPVEIRAVLAAAREGVENRVIAVVQPHRYSRLGALMDEFQSAFNDADMVYVAPVYPAGEAPIEGVDAAALVAGLKQRGHRSAQRRWTGRTQLATDARRDRAAGRHDRLPRRRRHHQMGRRPRRCDRAARWTRSQRGRMKPIGNRFSTSLETNGERIAHERLPLRGRCAGSVEHQGSLADFIWFRTGGDAEWLFAPADDVRDLSAFLAGL